MLGKSSTLKKCFARRKNQDATESLLVLLPLHPAARFPPQSQGAQHEPANPFLVLLPKLAWIAHHSLWISTAQGSSSLQVQSTHC